MEEKHSARKTSILEAARSLGVSTKTIQRYLAKGLLTKIREGGRTYVLMSDLHSLTAQGQGGQGFEAPVPPFRDLEPPLKDTVILDREDYDGLLMELAELRRGTEKDLEQGGTLGDLQEKVGRAEGAIKELQHRMESLELGLSAMERRISEGTQASVEREDASKTSKPPKPWWQK
jgi:hypothetical protein